MASDFLFEIGCEELPSAAVKTLSEALGYEVGRILDEAKLAYETIQGFGTPRRLAVLVKHLQQEQQGQTLVRRGPAAKAAYDAQGEPSKALLGFVKSCNAELKDLSIINTEKGEWVVYEAFEQGAKTRDILPDLMTKAVAKLPIPKPMRWGDGDIEFTRPVHWIVMLYGEEVIDATLFGITSERYTYGHRFHHPEAIKIDKPEAYEPLLEKGFVIVDFAKRKEQIKQQVEHLARKAQAQAIMPEELLDEVASIVEWPQALLAQFPEEFLNVPSEALIASMQAHQKCFALKNTNQELLPKFITVANLVSLAPEQVIAGNQKVMRARLSDAAFFYNMDKKQPLSAHLEATKNVVFQARLGSLYDKSLRIKTVMEELITPFQLDKKQAQRAAELSKCDLLTNMVGEFPELQGVMGYYYAKEDKEDRAVAEALQEQYLPRFAGDALPVTTLGKALSLAERLDTLVGIFAIGQKPSGVKDPFKLRRHALAVARILMNSPERLSLDGLITRALRAYDTSLNFNEQAISDLKPFILDRLQAFYQGQGIRIDIIQAVRARQTDWLYDFDCRLHALEEFVVRPEAAVLSAACKRVNNLLQHAGLDNDRALTVQKDLLAAPQEQQLYMHLCETEALLESLAPTGNYQEMLKHLARLREPVDAFFDQVMVMVDEEDIKMNRLALLQRMASLLQSVAQISLLQLH